MALTPKQQRFVDEYLIDLNAAAAYKRAGYAARGNSAEASAARLLRNAQVRSFLTERMKARERRTEITQDRVLQELARIAFFDIRKLYNADGTLKRPDQLDDDAAAVLAGVDVTEQTTHEMVDGELKATPVFTKKAKVFDKTAALTLAMRHLGMLKDKIEHSGEIKNPELKLVLNGTNPASPPDAGIPH
jgi:phage terminase small subunit